MYNKANFVIKRLNMVPGNLFNKIAKNYDFTNDILSFGLHRHWKAFVCNYIIEQNSKSVLDICTGTGDLVVLFQKKGKLMMRIVGVDIEPAMLEIALKKFASAPSVTLIHADACNLPFSSESFEATTIAFGIRNVSDRCAALREVLRVLVPGGTLLILEFGKPLVKPISWLYWLYLKLYLPLVGGFLANNRLAYKYLADSAWSYPCGPQFSAILQDAGFVNISWKALAGGIAYLYTCQKPF